MKREEFEYGYKLLFDFIKDKGIYRKMTNIIFQNQPINKEKLWQAFNVNGKNWYDFFDYTYLIGPRYMDLGLEEYYRLRYEWKILTIAFNDIY